MGLTNYCCFQEICIVLLVLWRLHTQRHKHATHSECTQYTADYAIVYNITKFISIQVLIVWAYFQVIKTLCNNLPQLWYIAIW